MSPDLDVVIIGAGTAGAAAALQCARRGLRVQCIDRQPLGRSGAHWINGVAGAAFDEARIDRPRGEELFGAAHDFHLVAGYGPERIVMRGHDVLEVDMRLLVARLQAQAAEAGAVLRGDVHVEGFDGTTLRTNAGPLRARWYVDAAGLAGPRLLRQPPVDRRDLCAAAQAVYAVSDVAAAREWFAARGTPPGDTLCFTCVAGGYSIINVRLAGERLTILTGSIPAEGHPSGQQLLTDFIAKLPWVGALEFGGQRAIPLRAPYAEIARENVALLGDSACQVFSAHGSGIGPGLYAARVLADALADGRGTAGYAAQWQREKAALFTAYDLFRRLSQRLTSDDLRRMMARGLLDEETARAGLEQRWPELSARWMLPRISGAVRELKIARAFLPVAGRIAALRLLDERYPRSGPRVARWPAVVARAAGLGHVDLAPAVS